MVKSAPSAVEVSEEMGKSVLTLYAEQLNVL